MVFRRRVKCYNPINDTFAITNLFGNQFYANNENDLRSKNLHKSFACLRSALVVVIHDQGFKHAVPDWQKKWISTYNAVSVCGCVGVWKGWGGGVGG